MYTSLGEGTGHGVVKGLGGSTGHCGVKGIVDIKVMAWLGGVNSPMQKYSGSGGVNG